MPSSDTYFTSENQPEGRGRPKGSLSLKTIIRHILEQGITDENGDKTTIGYVMNKKIVDKAMAGDVSAFKSICDRLEGLPQQSVKQENTGKISVVWEDE